MYACKDCGVAATKEQVFIAAEKCKDLNAMMQGLTPWQCTRCRLQKIAKPPTLTEPSPLDLATPQDLVNELLKRFQHIIIAYRSIPVEGENRADEGYLHSGDYRMCQGIAMGMIQKLERTIMASHLKHAEEEGRDD